MLGVMQASDACCDFFPSKNVLNVFTVMDIGALWIKVGNEVDYPLAMKEFHVESWKHCPISVQRRQNLNVPFTND